MRKEFLEQFGRSGGGGERSPVHILIHAPERHLSYEALRRRFPEAIPAYLLYAEMRDIQAFCYYQLRDHEAVETARKLAWSIVVLAHQEFDTHELLGTMGEYLSSQEDYVKNGERLGGVTLTHEQGLELQWALRTIGIAIDPGNGDLCIPFAPFEREIYNVASNTDDEAFQAMSAALAQTTIKPWNVINLQEWQERGSQNT